ncbi:hypothetical protein AALP_AA3G359500 [Arabis alpina]|uniref:Uncharacterized protein n=1 Tax=Arabis alpina TaxID=50452 RepID=A0A087HDW8_ARAAL|nr:hypothetical protein AALP_AA3G359500 [Arabis alpina]
MDPYPVLPEFDEIPFVVKSEGYEWPAEAILTQEQEEEFLHVLYTKKKARRERQGMKYRRRGNPNPPGSTLCSAESLDKLRTEFEVPDEVECSLPRSSDRANNPPLVFFTMYENSIEECFLTFHIPPVILDYFWRNKIALAQATPRGIRHLVGILVRGRECRKEVSVYHYLNLLKIGSRGMVGNDMIVAIGAQVGCLVIDDQPTKDRHWINYFFYVKISEASMGDQWLEKVVTRWRYRGPSGFPPCPDGLFTDFLSAEMAAQERAHAENLAAGVETNPAGGQEGGVQDQPIVSGEISEVPQEKLKKSRRSNKPPRVPVPDGVIPSSEAGASASGTALEQDGESHSTQRKKKEISSKFERWPDAQTRLGIEMEHIKSVEFELQAYQRRCVEAEERAVEENVKASILQQQLADEKTGITSRIKRATKAAMRTFAIKFQGKIDRAKEKIRILGGNPKKKLVQLTQVEANIEFARILREAPDSFDAEVAKTEAWLPNVAGGDVEFDSLFA